MSLQGVFKASSLNEALELLELYKENSKIIAGGTDLVIKLREKRVKPMVLIDISSIKEMIGINISEAFINIGAATNFSSIHMNQLFQGNLTGLAMAAKAVGSPQIRNSATIGGNICNASPAADILPPLLALEAEVIIKSKTGERLLPLEELLVDKGKVDIGPQELLFCIKFPQPKADESIGFAKLGLRRALAIARISVAVFVEVKEDSFKRVRIATGACGRLPVREGYIEDFLMGRRIDAGIIEAAGEKFSEGLRERLAGRNAAEYKCEAIKGVFKEALTRAISYH